MRDLIRIECFSLGKRPGRAAADFPDQRAKMVADDELTELFVACLEGMQVVVVEEMAERTVADVMHQSGDAQELLDVIGGRRVGCRLDEERIQVARETAGDMHGPDRV